MKVTFNIFYSFSQLHKRFCIGSYGKYKSKFDAEAFAFLKPINKRVCAARDILSFVVSAIYALDMFS